MNLSILSIAIVVFFILCAVEGFKKGFVKETIEVVSLILGLIILFVLIRAIGNVIQGSYFHVIVAVLILAMLLAVDKVAKIILRSCKIVSELPVISWVNQLAGAIFSVAKGLIGIWLGFIVLGFFDIPIVQPWIMSQVEQSRFLGILYHSNYIVYLLKAILM